MTAGRPDRDEALARVVAELGVEGSDWRLLAVERLAEHPARWALLGEWRMACQRCGVAHPAAGGGAVEVQNSDIRNPKNLARLAYALGGSTRERFDAERGRRLVRALHAAEQVR